MKNMMFARTFPMTHPRKGEPTHFVEKIWKSLHVNGQCPDDLDIFIQHYEAQVRGEYAKYNDIHRKGHTIRSGNRWKVGDYFVPRVWSGKPYNSKTIQFAPPIKVENIWRFELFEGYSLTVDGQSVGAFCNNNPRVAEMGANDGLAPDDFVNWFSLPYKKKTATFVGQIICWNPRLEYSFLTPQQ